MLELPPHAAQVIGKASATWFAISINRKVRAYVSNSTNLIILQLCSTYLRMAIVNGFSEVKIKWPISISRMAVYIMNGTETEPNAHSASRPVGDKAGCQPSRQPKTHAVARVRLSLRCCPSGARVYVTRNGASG